MAAAFSNPFDYLTIQSLCVFLNKRTPSRLDDPIAQLGIKIISDFNKLLNYLGKLIGHQFNGEADKFLPKLVDSANWINYNHDLLVCPHLLFEKNLNLLISNLRKSIFALFLHDNPQVVDLKTHEEYMSMLENMIHYMCLFLQE